MDNNVLRTAACILLGWALVALIALAMSGCVDGLGDPELRTFDINDYIEASCIGDGESWYITEGFTGRELREIVDAIDVVNDTFDTDVQVCGVVVGELHPGTRSIQPWPGEGCGGDYDRDTTTIRLLQNKCHGYPYFYKVVLHEFGHALRNDYIHLHDKVTLMTQGWHGISEYTDADIAFINEPLQ